MNRASKTSNYMIDLINYNMNNINKSGICIKKNDMKFCYEFDILVKNAIRNETDNENYVINLNEKGTVINNLITLTDDNDVDYKDIIVNTWNAEDCLTKETIKAIFECLNLVPKIITGHYLRFVNVFQYNKYLNGSKGYDKIPDKYMTLEMAKAIIKNKGTFIIPDDLAMEISNHDIY